MEEMTGVVDSVVFDSGDGRFSVFRLVPDGQSSRVSVTIPSAAPLVGQEVSLQGEWVEHPRFGSQFQAAHIRVAAPTSTQGILRFLASGAVQGIGPAMAQRIVARFGEETLDVIENAPSRLQEVSGIGKKTAQKIYESYHEQSELKEIMLWLEMRGVSGTYGARIYKQYGSFALDVLERDPYRIAREVSGVGFRTADMIAMAEDGDTDSPQRIAAGLRFVLEGVASSGHCCLPEARLVRGAAEMLGVGKRGTAEFHNFDLHFINRSFRDKIHFIYIIWSFCNFVKNKGEKSANRTNFRRKFSEMLWFCLKKTAVSRIMKEEQRILSTKGELPIWQSKTFAVQAAF